MHPLPQLLEAGIQCSLNGDDPLLFGPVLLHEYELARTEMGLDDDALAVGGARVDPRLGRVRRAQGVGAGLDRRLARAAFDRGRLNDHDTPTATTSASTATTGSGHA